MWNQILLIMWFLWRTSSTNRTSYSRILFLFQTISCYFTLFLYLHIIHTEQDIGYDGFFMEVGNTGMLGTVPSKIEKNKYFQMTVSVNETEGKTENLGFLLLQHISVFSPQAFGEFELEKWSPTPGKKDRKKQTNQKLRCHGDHFLMFSHTHAHT